MPASSPVALFHLCCCLPLALTFPLGFCSYFFPFRCSSLLKCAAHCPFRFFISSVKPLIPVLCLVKLLIGEALDPSCLPGEVVADFCSSYDVRKAPLHTSLGCSQSARMMFSETPGLCPVCHITRYSHSTGFFL